MSPLSSTITTALVARQIPASRLRIGSAQLSVMVKSVEQAVQRLEREQVRFVRFEVGDTHGISRCKTVPLKHFKAYANKGLNIGLFPMTPQCHLVPVSYAGDAGFPDSYLHADLDTLAIVPWVPHTARVLCTASGVFDDATPRNVALRQIARLHKAGYSLLSGCELEFYMVDAKTKEAAFSGINPYSTLKGTFDKPLVHDILQSMMAMDIDLITTHSEFGPGQMEVVWAPEFGIKAADDAFTFKNGVKEICQDAGKMASFMSAPYASKSGNGFHYGQSLWSVDERRCLMFDENAPHKLSDVAQHWIAGQLRHAPALSALCAPTANCAKRYKAGDDLPPGTQRCPGAPTTANWGIENRTCLLRVKVNGEDATYVENRLGCGGANPYLLMAGMIAAGLDGIERRLPLPPPQEGAAFACQLRGRDAPVDDALPPIPQDLSAALKALEDDSPMADAFGAKFIEIFGAVKREEIRIGKEAVGDALFDSPPTDWEREMYFEPL